MMRAGHAVRLAIVVLALAACSGGQQAAASPTPSASATPLVTQNLVFTGPAAGTLNSAATSCNLFTAATQLNVGLTGKLAGQDLSFNIQINSGYSGPGDYPVGGLGDRSAEVRMSAGSYDGSTATGAGKMTVNSDGKSGTIDADLSGGEHVKGAFACAEVATA